VDKTAWTARPPQALRSRASSPSRERDAREEAWSETPAKVAVGLLFLADAAFVALFLLMQATGVQLEVLSVAEERSVPTWYASAKLLLVGQALVAAAFLLPRPARAARLALLGLRPTPRAPGEAGRRPPRGARRRTRRH
jgi:hypothetical protein